MNNLSELQGELRKLSAALDALSRQVEDLKPQEADEARDFSALESLARQEPIQNPALAKAGEYEQDLYLRMICTAAFLEDAGRLDKLLYLCRLAAGSGCARSAAELMKMAYDTGRLDWQSAAGELKALALPMLLDMMMLGSMAGPADERTLDFIASAAELMEVSEADATVAAQLAAALLAQDKRGFGKIGAKRAYPELSWMVPEEWLASERRYRNKYKIRAEREYKAKRKDSPNYSWYSAGKAAIVSAQELVPSGTFVEAGTPLISFERKFAAKEDRKSYDFVSAGLPSLNTAQAGMVFFAEISPEEKLIYIASPFDCEEAIAAWHKTQKNKKGD